MHTIDAPDFPYSGLPLLAPVINALAHDDQRGILISAAQTSPGFGTQSPLPGGEPVWRMNPATLEKVWAVDPRPVWTSQPDYRGAAVRTV